jgi:hypothetical protein
MKVWFTRPSTWDLYVRGVERCDLWLQKPSFDNTQRGRERDPILHTRPIGWRVQHPEYGDITSQVSVTVGEVIPVGQHTDVLDALWDALCRSVDGKGPLEGGPAPQRWIEPLDAGQFIDDDDGAMAGFLFEYDVSPELWFKAALLNGEEYQTAAGRWAQKLFPLDDEMGVAEAELPAVAQTVIEYDGAVAITKQHLVIPG